MSVTLKSGVTTDIATVDPTSKAVRVTQYSSAGVEEVPLADGGAVNVTKVGGVAVTNLPTNIVQVAGVAVTTGHGTASGAQRVELPTDGTGVVGLNAGSAIVGKVGIDQTTPGTTNNVAIIAGQNGVAGGTGVDAATVQRVSLATNVALPTGTNVLGRVGIDQTTPGTTNRVAANLDQVAGATVAQGHGVAATALRVELPTDGTGVVGLNTGSNIVGRVGIDQTTPGTTNNVAIISGQNGVAGGTGVDAATVQRVTLATNVGLPAGTNTIGSVQQAASTTATESSVAGSASSVTILALNTGRLGMSVYNDSTAILYLRASATAATTSAYTVQVSPGFYWEQPATIRYTGQYTGIWASAAGNARVTEYSA